MLRSVIILFLAPLSLSLAAPRPSPSKPIASFLPPTISFQRRWKTKLQNFPMGYSSASLAVQNGTIFVLNGAEVGNYVEQFDLTGNYQGEWPGWYNWPDEMVMGPRGDLVVSALGAMLEPLGAMDDQHMLAP